ncbi:MAG: hypothetical protein CM15mP22_6900 [Gammaproteobacteria bacterium]|nr:MAG: hypothetical protein CM15mP22_6900 [Gammaproteobacteria bacterium]
MVFEQDGFHHEKLVIQNYLHGQSSDIALGTENFWGGDQGHVCYAAMKREDFMPSAIHF